MIMHYLNALQIGQHLDCCLEWIDNIRTSGQDSETFFSGTLIENICTTVGTGHIYIIYCHFLYRDVLRRYNYYRVTGRSIVHEVPYAYYHLAGTICVPFNRNGTSATSTVYGSALVCLENQ
eukprot:jgi/Botrbrau1/8481/Bobra.0237s0097.1